MKPLSAVIAHKDSKTAESLVKPLYNHFRAVHTAGNLSELRQIINERHADVAVVDLELVPLDQVRSLVREYGATTMICTHRLADEQLWTDALAAGAADCLHSLDVRAIVLAAHHATEAIHPHAA